jgi:hypothetical protein
MDQKYSWKTKLSKKKKLIYVLLSQKFAESPFILTTQPIVIYLLKEKSFSANSATHGQPYDIFVGGTKYSQLLLMG